MAVDRDCSTSRLIHDNKIFCTTLFWCSLKCSSVKLTKLLVIHLNAPWKSVHVIKLTIRIRTTCVNSVCDIMIRCHAVALSQWGDAKEYIQSAWGKQHDYLLLGSRNHCCGCWLFWNLHFSKIIWRLALGFKMDRQLNAMRRSPPEQSKMSFSPLIPFYNV